jgi:pyridoxine 5'-phosphate synthase PdxJ
MTALSVNVNKIAVLRNSRGGDEPGVRVRTSAISVATTCWRWPR